ncbi:Calx-beta domain-containing protein [Butyricimonas sp.]|uniref:Calx-beta domain-containing protein n=1 Tax=Butyricimonas sp. TaxID=1969738 RepID=UPI0025BB0AAF|nr:Calx-beta domain-containing protein [Butyricimonas sp.]
MKNIWIFLLTLLTYGMLSCHDDNNDDASLSFGRSIYILQANGALEVELRADGAVEEQTVVKFTVGGSAVRGEDYELSADEFVLEAGQDRAKIQIQPKENYNEDREIRLELEPVAGFQLGDKRVVIIPIETKEQMIISFERDWRELEDELIVKVTVAGAVTGKYNSTEPLSIPFVIGNGTTAEAGVHYEIEGDVNAFVIKPGEDKAEIKVRYLLVEEGHDRLELALTLPDESFYFGNYNEMEIPIVGPLSMNKLAGKWTYSAFMCQDYMEMLVGGDFPDDLTALPTNNSATDILEFVTEDGMDMIKVHMTGDLRNYFRDTEIHIGSTGEEYLWETLTDLALVTSVRCDKVNLHFSPNQVKEEETTIGMRLVEGGEVLEIRILQYEPIEFLYDTYEMFEGDMEMFPLVFRFAKVKE